MENREYASLIAKLGLTHREFADLSGVNVHGVRMRCRVGLTRITARAELHILRFVAGRLLGKPLSPPMLAMKHDRPPPDEWRKARKRDPVSAAAIPAPAAARGRLCAGTVEEARAAFVGKPPTTPPKPVTCAAKGCMRPVEALPGALLCPQHAIESGWLGLKRFK
jgi:hypothetical protein